MPKKFQVSVGGPEMKTYFVEIKTPKLRRIKEGIPEPPPNFPPEELPIQNDFYERRQERARRRDEYMRGG
mgnify:FL=1